MRKEVFSGLAAVAVLFTLAGCGGGDNSSVSATATSAAATPATFAALSGTWRATRLINAQGATFLDSCPIAAEGSELGPNSPRVTYTYSCGADDTFTFRDDGTFTVTTAATINAAPSAPDAATTVAPFFQVIYRNPDSVKGSLQTPVTFSGRWTQSGAQVLLIVDSNNHGSFPYETSVNLRSSDQMLLPVSVFPSGSGYVFTRQ